MRDILDSLDDWRSHGVRFAVATVVGVRGSSPRAPGVSMAVSEHGVVVGSISGGCVEAAIYDLAMDVLAHGGPRLATFGSDADAAGEELLFPGLTCGGEIDVVVRGVDATSFAAFDEVVAAVTAGQPVAVVTAVSGIPSAGTHLAVFPDASVTGTLGSAVVDESVAARAAAMLRTGTTAMVYVAPCPSDETDGEPAVVFVEAMTPPAQMLIFGALDYADALAGMGKFLGYRTVVCDARPLFATPARFPDADEIVVDWPQRFLASTSVDDRTVICVLTHDPKFDVPTIVAALRTPARYVGVMGSRRTHDDRLTRLRAAGVSEDDLDRLCSPIGLDLGARTPQETAVAIAAEIIATQTAGTGAQLRRTTGPIHR